MPNRIDLIKKYELYAPKGFLHSTEKHLDMICNGIGPAGWGWICPDTIYGLSITEIGDIHDYMFWEGETHEDWERSNRVFYNNCLRKIEMETKWKWLKWLRRRRAYHYYILLKRFSSHFYWKGKTDPHDRT